MSLAPGSLEAGGSASRALTDTLRRGLSWIDQRSPRERALLLAVCLGTIYAACGLLLMQPLRERQAALRDEEHKVLEQIEEFGRQEEEIRRAHAADLDRPLRVRADDLTEQIANFDERIRHHTVALVPPREMAMVLEEVLRREGGLRLARLEYLGAEPVLEPSKVGARSGAGIQRHRFEIELRGSYLPTLTYLRALEDLPWTFFWEALEYRVGEHPVGTAIIRVFTLGPEEGWVGA